MVSHITDREVVMNESTAAPSRPRVWLVGTIGTTPDPADRPAVRDTGMRTWRAGTDGVYHSADGRHHATWAELHARCDLVEVA
jgi:hypothetical protein